MKKTRDAQKFCERALKVRPTVSQACSAMRHYCSSVLIYVYGNRCFIYVFFLQDEDLKALLARIRREAGVTSDAGSADSNGLDLDYLPRTNQKIEVIAIFA